MSPVLENHHSEAKLTVLLDNAKGNPICFPSSKYLSVLASSPKAENYEEWEKLNGKKRIHLPTWTLEELSRYLLLVAPPHVDENEMKSRFEK